MNFAPPKENVVLVVGAGSAGIAAAISSARTGKETLLVERQGAPGGMASNALVHTLCGFFLLRNDTTEPLVYANEGFPREYVEYLLSSGAAGKPERLGRLDVIPQDPAALATATSAMLSRQAALKVFSNTTLVALESSGGRITIAKIQSHGRTIEIPVDAVVDASGDGEAAALAGADYECAPAERLQRPAYIFGIQGARTDALDGDAKLNLAARITAAVQDGKLPNAALGGAFRYGMSRTKIWATIDLTIENYDPCSPQCIAGMQATGKDTAGAILDFLKSNMNGFEGAILAHEPVQLGIRESRRITGRAVLTGDDILQGRMVQNPAAISSWPLELRETAGGPRWRFPIENRSAGISLDVLRSKTFENLFLAGRCISCTHEAQAAIRVIGTCMATGEAAGKAAAYFQ